MKRCGLRVPSDETESSRKIPPHAVGLFEAGRREVILSRRAGPAPQLVTASGRHGYASPATQFDQPSQAIHGEQLRGRFERTLKAELTPYLRALT